jgi:hypothetical protein
MNCSKVKFTKREAQESLNFLSGIGKQFRKEKRTYYCKECNAWHLTSREDIEEVKAKNVRLKFKDKWKQYLKN